MFIYIAHVFLLLLQLWDTLRVLGYQDDLRTRCAHSPFATSILKMRSEGRCPSPGSGQKCLIGKEDIKRVEHDQEIIKGSLPGNAMKTYSDYQYLSTSHDSGEIAYIMGRLWVTIWPSLSSADTDWCTLAPQLDRLGLRLQFQVLVPPVLL